MKLFTAIFLLPVSCVLAVPASSGLSDPDIQPKFSEIVPNPLDPSFIFDTSSGYIRIGVGEGKQRTGLISPDGQELVTPIWGYGTGLLGYTWPGRTIVVQTLEVLQVKWVNKIPIWKGYLITGKDNGAAGDYSKKSVVDTSFHWSYGLRGYRLCTIRLCGTPIVPHLHGGHTSASFDGNPEYFFSPAYLIRGPQWESAVYTYDDSQPSSLTWIHDHALGITRLNVYTGMAMFYVIRNDADTGLPDNPLNLPAFPYEIPLAIQDRMFKENGELFYPAFPGDPFYDDFITDEGADLGMYQGASALAEFFGDHIVVNGKIWPKLEVEPRNYRLRLLNGCDSRFLVIEFVAVELGATSLEDAGKPISFYVIGADQGLGEEPEKRETLVIEPSSRFDVVFDFSDFEDERIIIKNTGGDEPFGGDIPGPVLFEHTDKIMAFDVVRRLDRSVPDRFDPDDDLVELDEAAEVDRTRRLALFEGRDRFGRLQPFLGTIDPATDKDGNPICWPNDFEHRQLGLGGKQMTGTLPWSAPTTENPELGATEDWEIWNLSADAHPMHLHLVNFALVDRKEIVFDSNAMEGEIPEGVEPAGDGTYLRPRLQPSEPSGQSSGFEVVNPTEGDCISDDDLPEYSVDFPLDSITALPGQITTIRAFFDKPGRFNWHCHILAHEDHEMMRLLHVGDLPPDQAGGICSDAPERAPAESPSRCDDGKGGKGKGGKGKKSKRRRSKTTKKRKLKM